VRIGHEGHDPDIDVVAAAGPIDDLAGDEGAVGGGLVQGFQGLLGVGFLFGEDEVAFLVVGPFQRGFDLVAGLGRTTSGPWPNSSRGIIPSDFMPMSTRTWLAAILMTLPLTMVPGETSFWLNWYLSSRVS